MQCPIDHTRLESKPYEADIEVGECPLCGGIWLERGELEAIEDSREHDYSEELARMPDLGYRAYDLALQKRDRHLVCSKCDTEMETREYARCSQVMIDVCPQCHGVWLDKGELEDLEIFYERSRHEAAGLRRGFLAGLKAMLT
jgi:Zn-finger nucleic acid-binding protein